MTTSMATSSSSINLEAAAHEAALADGIISSSLSDNSKVNDTISKTKKAGLRRGKWTAEEESYANRLISEFKMGLLPLTDGTTLRTFLSKLLNCDPMRISKKFVGGNCIGKQVFRRRVGELENLTGEQIERSRKELADLERKFLERVAQTNRSKTGGGGVVKSKEGKAGGYGDEEGTLAPWMMPPEDPQYSTLDVLSTQPSSSASYQQQSPRGSYKIRLPQYQNGEPGGQIQNDGTIAAHGANGGSSSMAALYGFPPYQPQYHNHDQNQDSHMNMGGSNYSSMTGSGTGVVDDYSHACNMNMSSHSNNMNQGQGQNQNNQSSSSHNNGGNNESSMNSGYSLTSGSMGNNNSLSSLGPLNGNYSSSSLGRVNSLDVLCSLDIIKFPSPQSMDGLTMYGQIGEDPFPWSSNPGAGSNSGLYGGGMGMPLPLGYRSSLSQSSNSFGRSSLWPSMNNLVNAAEAVSNCEAMGEDRGSSELSRLGELGSLGSMVNIHKQFGGTGLGSMLSLDGIDCNAAFAGETAEEERLPARDGASYDSGDRTESPRGQDIGHKHTQANPQSIGFSLDGRLSGVTSAAALRVSEIERASAPAAAEAIKVKAEVVSDSVHGRGEGSSPRGGGGGIGMPPTNVVSTSNSISSVPLHGSEGSGAVAHSGGQNEGQVVGIKTEKFLVNPTNGHTYPKQMSISSHSAALIPSSSGYGNVPINSQYHSSNVALVPIPLSQPQHMHMMQLQQQQYEQAQIAQKYHLAMPRNSSVENFWMLVDMGDLPQPDNNVLSETLWNSEHSAAPSMIPNAALSGSYNGVPLTGGRPVGQKIYRGKGAKQLAAELEAGELARGVVQEKEKADEAAAAAVAALELRSARVGYPPLGPGCGEKKVSDFNADAERMDTKSEIVSTAFTEGAGARHVLGVPIVHTHALSQSQPMEAMSDESSEVAAEGEGDLEGEGSDGEGDADDVSSPRTISPSSSMSLAVSAPSELDSTADRGYALDKTHSAGMVVPHTQTHVGLVCVQPMGAVDVSYPAEADAADGITINIASERVKRKFDDVDNVHTHDSDIRGITPDGESPPLIKKLDDPIIYDESSTPQQADTSSKLFRGI